MMKLLKKVKIHPLTYFIIISACITGLFKYLLLIAGIVLIHEFGHIIIATYFKRKITSITILPFGGMTKIDSIISTNIEEDLLISIGGIGMQLILVLVMFVINKLGLIDYKLYVTFHYYNYFLILFNLMPINPLDGYKIMKLLCEKIVPFKYSFYLGFAISFTTIIIFILLKQNIIYNNLLVFTFLVFMTIKDIFVLKHILNRFYLERMNRKFAFKNKNIKKIEHMYKNKNNLINKKNEPEFIKEYYYRKRVKKSS